MRHTSVTPCSRHLAQHLDRLLHRAGAVVHGRAGDGSGGRSRVGDRADAAPRWRSPRAARAPVCAWASSARVISASAASRSSATERSPGWASTRSSARRPPRPGVGQRSRLARGWRHAPAPARGAPRAPRLVCRSSQSANRQAPFRFRPRRRARRRPARGSPRAPRAAAPDRPRRRRRSADGHRPCRR